MLTRSRDRSYILLVVSLSCCMLSGVVSFDHAMAVDLTDLGKQIAAAAKRPAEVAKLTYEAISADAEHAAQTVRVVTEEVPPLVTVVTAAAVHAAPHRATEIVQAVAATTPMQAKKVEVAAHIAAALTVNPAESNTIIGAEIVVQPERAATIVTAAVTVCSVLEACPHSTVEELVQAAVAADRNVVEDIVGAVVWLMPAQSGAIIAAVGEAMTSIAALPTPGWLGAYGENESEPASQPDQVANAPMPDLPQTGPMQRARVVPVRVDQSDTEAVGAQQPGRRQTTLFVQEDQASLNNPERVGAQPQQQPTPPVLAEVPQQAAESERHRPERVGRPRPLPASPFLP